ncbi:hypothetical protein JL475_00450 [Streptomyces sp. M2CJ-2]|nr:hypothetical protein [Streptomyces sp. M2CJ-2]MBL3664516.1 hypothetical protein [Streptomyces sp. M2CJ-2]
MSDTVRIAFGVIGILGGTAGLVGAFIFYRTGKRTIADLKNRLGLPGSRR